jgi:hypothetical protein
MARYNGSGWHNQSVRHSNARKYGKAGGTYAVFKKDKYGLNAEKVGDFNKKAFLVFDKNKFNIIKNPEFQYNIVPRGTGWEHYPIKTGFKTEEEAREYAKNNLGGMRGVRITQSTKSKKHFGEAEKGETAGQVLERLSTSSTSSETDSKIMQAVLRQTGLYPNAVVVMGVVYLDGHGTMQNPPQSIHSVAKVILKAVEQAKKGKHYGNPMSFAGRTNKTLRIGTIPIGGRRGSLYINLELRPDGEFSVSGVEAPLPSGNALGSTGQIDMEYKHANKEEDDERYTEEGLTKPEQIRFAKGWNKDKWLKLLSIWKNKHLTKNLSSEELRFLNSLPDTDKTPAWI